MACIIYKANEARKVYFPQHPKYSMQIQDNKPIIELVHPNATFPKRATEESAGMDVTAVEKVVIPVGCQALVPLGFKVKAPAGCYVRVAPRSGLALKHMALM